MQTEEQRVSPRASSPRRKRRRSLQSALGALSAPGAGEASSLNAYEILGELYSAFGQVEHIVRERLAANEKLKEDAEQGRAEWDASLGDRHRAVHQGYEVPLGPAGVDPTADVEFVVGGTMFRAPVKDAIRRPETLFTVLLRQAAQQRLAEGGAAGGLLPDTLCLKTLKRKREAMASEEKRAPPAAKPLRIVIDRDPAFFQNVLEYLKAPDSYSLHAGMQKPEAERIKREADFYGLPGLRRLAIRCTSMVVSKQRDARFTTVASAVAASVDGDKIVVLPGRYEESIATNKRIEICGESGTDGVVEICTTRGSPTMLFTGNGGGVLRNLTLQEASPFGVTLVECRGKSSVLIDHCDLSTNLSNHSNAINAVDESSLHILNSSIHDVRGTGVFLRDKATATLRGNAITNMGSCGLFTRHHTRFYLENNTISHAALGGCDINDFSLGTVESCTFKECLRGGLVFYGSSHIRVKGNTVVHNEYGMRSFEDSQVILSANVIRDNKVAQVQGTALNRAMEENGQAASE